MGHICTSGRHPPEQIIDIPEALNIERRVGVGVTSSGAVSRMRWSDCTITAVNSSDDEDASSAGVVDERGVVVVDCSM